MLASGATDTFVRNVKHNGVPAGDTRRDCAASFPEKMIYAPCTTRLQIGTRPRDKGVPDDKAAPTVKPPIP